MNCRYIKLLVDSIYPDTNNLCFVHLAELVAKTADSTNMALNKNVTYSSQYDSTTNKAANIVDGVIASNGWASKNQYPTLVVNGAEWVGVDLGAVYNITEIDVCNSSYSSGGVLKAYRLYVSGDGTNYNLVYTATDMNNTVGRMDSIKLSNLQEQVI